jgi:hypothetical protein
VPKRESKYQTEIVKRIEDFFPGCIVLKNDEQYRPGFPDLTVLWKDQYAVLEVKRSAKEPFQPNQLHYLQYIAMEMGSFSEVICPENEEEVLDALQHTFESRR